MNDLNLLIQCKNNYIVQLYIILDEIRNEKKTRTDKSSVLIMRSDIHKARYCIFTEITEISFNRNYNLHYEITEKKKIISARYRKNIAALSMY